MVKINMGISMKSGMNDCPLSDSILVQLEKIFGSEDTSGRLFNLGFRAFYNYKRSGRVEDLDGAAKLFEEHLALIPSEHRDRPGLLLIQAEVADCLYQKLGRAEALELTIYSYREICRIPCFNQTYMIWGMLAWLRSATRRGAWEEAVEASSYGRAFIHLHLEERESRAERWSWLSHLKDMSSLSAYALAMAGGQDGCREAVLVLEETRSVWLTERMHGHGAVLNELKKTQPGLVRQYWQASERFRSLASLACRTSEEEGPVAALRLLEFARRELEESLDAIRRIPGYERFLALPVWSDIAAVIENRPAESCIVYLTTTAVGSLMLIVGRNALVPLWTDLTINCLDGLVGRIDRGGVQEKIDALLCREGDPEQEHDRSYLEGMSAGDDLGVPFFRERLDAVLSALGEKMMDPLAEALRHLGLKDVALIPTGILSLIPLHAAFCGSDRACFMDLFRTRYAPNARALGEAAVEADRRAANAGLFGLGNPLPCEPPLEFALCEMQEIESRFRRLRPKDHHIALYEKAAQKDDLRKSIANCGHFHHAGHVILDTIDVLRSRLLLADGGSLTLREVLYECHFNRARLVVLSACQSAVPDLQIPDEYIGLSAGFAQKVPGVVGTLWPVNDLSTSLLMDRFYLNYLERNLEPAESLRQAQIWLRDLTCRELVQFYEDHPAINAARETAILAPSRGDRHAAAFSQDPWYMPELELPDLRPFAKRPEHWAGFIFIGI
jgi:CHAT domain-containing protein